MIAAEIMYVRFFRGKNKFGGQLPQVSPWLFASWLQVMTRRWLIRQARIHIWIKGATAALPSPAKN